MHTEIYFIQTKKFITLILQVFLQLIDLRRNCLEKN